MTPTRAPYKGQSYKLFNDYNEIHIFIEDEGFENLYNVLLKKHDIRVEKIFSRNGKSSILKSATLCDDEKCIFIIDRDWDDLLGITHPQKNIITLNLNSIESYLINYDTLSGVVISEKPKCNIESTLSKKDYAAIVTSVSNHLRPLFECFSVMQLNGTNKKGCSHKPGHFKSRNSSCAPDPSKINSFIINTKVTIPKQVTEYFSDTDLTNNGHGKYMLNYIWEGVRHKTKIGKISIEKLMIRLAQLLDSPELEDLCHNIVLTAKQNQQKARRLD